MSNLKFKLSMLSCLFHEINAIMIPVLGYLELDAPLLPMTKKMETIHKQLLVIKEKIGEVHNHSEMPFRENAYQRLITELIQLIGELEQVIVSFNPESVSVDLSSHIKKGLDRLKEIKEDLLLSKRSTD